MEMLIVLIVLVPSEAQLHSVLSPTASDILSDPVQANLLGKWGRSGMIK